MSKLLFLSIWTHFSNKVNVGRPTDQQASNKTQSFSGTLTSHEDIYLKKACILEVSSDQIHTRNRRHTVLE